MNNLNEKIALIEKMKHQLVQDFKIKEIGIFGSYIRNENNLQSDLDVLIDFTEYPGFIKYMQLENLLSEVLKVKVDLVLKKSLKKTIGANILREVRMI
jgi:hypothetical protein